MSDVADRAHDTEELLRGLALRQHFSQAKPPAGNGICTDCNGPIPAARLAAQPNAQRCISCETDTQKRRSNQIAMRPRKAGARR